MIHALDIVFPFHDRIILCLFAAVTHAVFLSGRVYGFMPLALPVRAAKAITELLERRLNRMGRSESVRRSRGVIATVVLSVLAIGLGGLIGWVTHTLPAGEFLELIVIAISLSARPTFDTAMDVFDLVKHHKKTPEAIARGFVHTHSDIADSSVSSRICVETLMVRLQTGFIAPLLWYILLGLPALFVCVMFTMAHDTLKKRGMYGWSYGRAIRFVYLCLQSVPNLIAGCVICIAAAFIPSCHPLDALRNMVIESIKIRHSGSGWVLGAASGACAIKLAGAQSNYLLYSKTPWIGNGSDRVGARDVVRALFLYGIALQIITLCIAGLLYASKAG